VDFATGVKTLLRQDPDIIMIGEIRDRETAEMAVQAALTGHLVLSTLHTNDAPSAVARLTEIGVPPYLISATVLGVVAQRLVRTLCPHCKRMTDVDLDQWRSMIRPWTNEPPAQIAYSAGCLHCRNTGYLGRKGLYEMMPLSDKLKSMIGPDLDLQAFRRQAIRGGMRPLNLAGAQKVARGMTSISEVVRVAPPRYEG
jgi:general secretion pathway protein E